MVRGSPALSFQHPYPPTKLGWVPDREGSRPDLLATSGDYLRLWRVADDPGGQQGVHLEKLLNNVSGRCVCGSVYCVCGCVGAWEGAVWAGGCRGGGWVGCSAWQSHVHAHTDACAHARPAHLHAQNKGSEYAAPLTSFDWNELDPRRVGTASIDTTCTVWDVERGVVDTQVLARACGRGWRLGAGDGAGVRGRGAAWGASACGAGGGDWGAAARCGPPQRLAPPPIDPAP